MAWTDGPTYRLTEMLGCIIESLEKKLIFHLSFKIPLGVKIGGEKFIALRSDKIEKNGPDAIYTTIVRKGNNGASIARVKNCK